MRGEIEQRTAGPAGPRRGGRAPRHAFTVDVEDWFHVLDCPQTPRVSEYTGFESRVERGVERILNMLADSEVRGTFFVLGWIAEKNPAVVRRIAEYGHELAVHGYAHQLAETLSDVELREDAKRAVDAVAQAAGRAPVGYRSPGGSLLNSQRFIFDVLLELGIRFDSSVYPRTGRRCAPTIGQAEGFPVRPYAIHRSGERILWEYPSTIFSVFGMRAAFAEGGYLRLLPLELVTKLFEENEKHGIAVNLCVHPREFDPGHPLLPVAAWKRWRITVGRRGLQEKVERLLSRYAFCPMGEIIEELEEAEAGAGQASNRGNGHAGG